MSEFSGHLDRTPFDGRRMKAHEIFRGLTAERVGEILGYIRENERDVYRTTLAALATQLRLRPLFVQKKPAVQQAAWMGKTLGLRTSDAAAEQLLQVWLLKANRDMLVAFLDGMGITHDGEGAVDELPESLESEKLGPVVDRLLEAYPAPFVTAYLHVFQLQTPDGWPELETLLQSDSRLRLDESEAIGEEPPAEEPDAAGENAAARSAEEAASEEATGEEATGEEATGEEATGEEATGEDAEITENGESQQAERTLAEGEGDESSGGMAEATPSSEEK